MDHNSQENGFLTAAPHRRLLSFRIIFNMMIKVLVVEPWKECVQRTNHYYYVLRIWDIQYSDLLFISLAFWALVIEHCWELWCVCDTRSRELLQVSNLHNNSLAEIAVRCNARPQVNHHYYLYYKFQMHKLIFLYLNIFMGPPVSLLPNSFVHCIAVMQYWCHWPYCALNLVRLCSPDGTN